MIIFAAVFYLFCLCIDAFFLRAIPSSSQDGENEMPASPATASAGMGDTGRADNPSAAQV
jgi:hypothetical protein